MDEFGFIRTLLAPLAEREPGALNLRDDAAFLDIPTGRTLVVTKDAIVAGVHFTGREAAGRIAQKLLRVNLSDLAAKGATPWGYFLALMLPPETDDVWLRDFAQGLKADQDEFGITLMGGDTTRTPGPLSLSLTALGLVAAGQGMTRSGAGEGDGIYVSGTLGDGALGLLLTQGVLTAPPEIHDALVGRYQLPCPRMALGQSLIGIASAAMDISDGLVQDLGHLCQASGLGAVIETGLLPFSPAAKALCNGTDILTSALSGGDDYELLFTAPVNRQDAIDRLAQQHGLPITRIGQMITGSEVRILGARGAEIPLTHKGFRHF